MKTITALLLILSYFIPLTFCQDMGSAKAAAKTFVRNSQEQLAVMIESGQMDQAEREIHAAIKACRSMADTQTCSAGIYFTAAWLYHQAVKSRGAENRESYLDQAAKYYNQVLSLLPHNQDALSNLMEVKQLAGSFEAQIDMLNEMMAANPDQQVIYLIRMGDLYRSQHDLANACAAYKKAYWADFYSADACRAMVHLHTSTDFSCHLGENVVYFGYDCQAIGLPNYAIDLFEHEISKAAQGSDHRAGERAVICWADVMAENGWLTIPRVDEMQRHYAHTTDLAAIRKPLSQLKQCLAADISLASRRSNFWLQKSPRIQISDNRQHISPLVVYLKIQHQQANAAYFAGRFEEAEKRWRLALESADHFHNAMYTLIAKNLAQLYLDYPGLDPLDTKFNRLVRKLFSMKGAAYSTSDKTLIREYHVTLGSIFYQREKWKGNGASNARHQLGRALSDQLGPIVNPMLRSMLAEVYQQINRPELALESFLYAVQDHLALDQFKEADELLQNTRSYLESQNLPKFLSRLEDLAFVLQLRQEWTSPQHPLLAPDASIYGYLTEMAQLDRKNFSALPSDFVKVQFFKGFTDLAMQMDSKHKAKQQILYAEALQKIRDLHILPSLTDLNRLHHIKRALEQSLEQPRHLPSMQVKQQADLNYPSDRLRERVITYVLPNLNREIEIPLALFKLRDAIQNHYEGDEKMGLPRIELDERMDFRVKG